jgi:mannonate dehydratase
LAAALPAQLLARRTRRHGGPYNVRSAFHGAADVGPVAQAASFSLQAVIPNFGVQEWTRYPEPVSEVVCGICRMENGVAYPNEAPGFGVDVDEAAAARYPYQRAYMPLVRRADGAMHVY